MSVDICPIIRGVSTSTQHKIISQLLLAGDVSTSSLQSHVSTLIPQLSSSSEQLAGLLSLLPLLRHSPTLCSVNCEKLLPPLCKIMTRPGLAPSTLRLVYQCLTHLISASVTSSDTGKLVSSLAPSLLSAIISSKPGPTLSPSLQVLVVLMSRYPGSCGQARSKLQDKLVTLLGQDGEEVGLELLGKCFSLLPQVGGGGREGAEHISQYSSLMGSLVTTVHTSLSTLYSHVREFDTYETSSSAPSLTLPTGSGGQMERNIVLAKELDRIMGVLGQLLTRGFPHVRQVPVDMFLSIPTRLLSLTLPASTTPSNQLLSTLHSQLTCSSLSLTCKLVKSLTDQLLPEAGSINSLLVSGLGRVSGGPVRAGLYSLLSSWLEGAGASSGVELCAGQLVTCMVKDIVPEKEKIVLEKANTNKKGRKHGKKGGGGGNGGNNSATSPAIVVSPLCLTTCSAALTSLELLLSTLGPWLDRETHTKISSIILSQLLSPCQQHPLQSLLLSCLTAMTDVSSPSLLSPSQLSLPALTILSNSSSLSPQVRRALLSLQSTLHPSRLTLDIQDTNIASINTVVDGKDCGEEIEDDEEDVKLCNTSTQTENTSNSDTAKVLTVEDSSKRIKELEDALKNAQAGEREARAQVMKKDIEISRAAINAQKRAAKEEKIAGEAKKLKISEEVHDVEEACPESAISTAEGSANSATVETGDGKLSVEEMLADFSDKLNSNLITTSIITESDSE